VVWSESDLTGRRVVHRAARTRTRNVDGFFDDLAIGSYVVHRQHGVAKFLGYHDARHQRHDARLLDTRVQRRPQLLAHEQIDALTPYSGGDAPALSRMGGAEWQKTRAKARAAAFLVAQELVDLYRQRSVAKGTPSVPTRPGSAKWKNLFAFTLTTDQAQAMEDIKADMELERPWTV